MGDADKYQHTDYGHPNSEMDDGFVIHFPYNLPQSEQKLRELKADRSCLRPPLKVSGFNALRVLWYISKVRCRGVSVQCSMFRGQRSISDAQS